MQKKPRDKFRQNRLYPSVRPSVQPYAPALFPEKIQKGDHSRCTGKKNQQTDITEQCMYRRQRRDYGMVVEVVEVRK
jgi:hypothetical protein